MDKTELETEIETTEIETTETETETEICERYDYKD